MCINKIYEMITFYSLHKIRNELFSFSIDDIISQVNNMNNDNLETVFTVSRNLVDREDKRCETIDNKTSHLMANVALILSIFISFIIYFMANQIDKIKLVDQHILLVTIISPIVLNLSVIILALYSMMPKTNWIDINDENLFGNIHENGDYYKKFLTVHYWDIFRNNLCMNEFKMKVQRITYMLHLVGVLFIVLSSSYLLTILFRKG